MTHLLRRAHLVHDIVIYQIVYQSFLHYLMQKIIYLALSAGTVADSCFYAHLNINRLDVLQLLVSYKIKMLAIYDAVFLGTGITDNIITVDLEKCIEPLREFHITKHLFQINIQVFRQMMFPSDF